MYLLANDRTSSQHHADADHGQLTVCLHTSDQLIPWYHAVVPGKCVCAKDDPAACSLPTDGCVARYDVVRVGCRSCIGEHGRLTSLYCQHSVHQ